MLNHTSSILYSQYLPSIEYFTILYKYAMNWIEINEVYDKKMTCNRCYILTSNTLKNHSRRYSNIEKDKYEHVQCLSVPIHKKKGTIIKDIEITYTHKWQHEHWNAIQTAYGKSPFFEFYKDYFKDIYFKKHKFLVDLNIDLLTLCLNLLKLPKNFKIAENLIDLGFENEGQIGYNNLKGIAPTTNGTIYQTFAYPQNFGNTFVPNLSIIDLLFMEGPQTVEVLKKSIQM